MTDAANNSAVEALTVIFWLATWASLASAASQLSGAYYSPTADAATLGIDVGTYVNSALGNYGNYLSDIRTAVNCIKASAALGALEWVLFCVSLGFLSKSPNPAVEIFSPSTMGKLILCVL